ncbi:hypothetical protein ciss_03390 [Carboxydothermus islandicus]|uniref:Leucyl aminopeptidase n=1 Tax=Carboxydothermus islandicus TaxID=661089 RepID=A0A1L8CZN7_9THEO|nr:aminopeptidase [Carboxydothermus islandicus]GAV24406.1 hypothetical protein ciss_03390 [Carboxydothermus islandicus]
MALKELAKNFWRKNFNLKPFEKVIIVFDNKREELARALSETAVMFKADLGLVKIYDADLPPDIEDRLVGADIVVFLTEKSYSHHPLRVKACEAGARIASLPKITSEIFKRAAQADYEKLEARTKILADLLTAASEVKITSALGTNFTVNIRGKSGLLDIGNFTEPGNFGNFPAGEASLAPVLEGTSGVLVVDGRKKLFGPHPLIVRVEDGRVVNVEGPGSTVLEEYFNVYGEKARIIGEFGIGSNEHAHLESIPLEAEKAMGTVHLALGNNLSFGGDNDVRFHLDLIITQPTVALDGNVIIKKGKLLI